MEEWSKIPSLEGYYASNLGRIKSTRQRRFQNIGEHILVQNTCSEGYKRVRVMNNGKTETRRVHRLVAEAFIPNPESKSDVNHIDFNRSNNCVENLEWTTRQENCSHSAANYSKAKKGKIIMKNKKLHHIEVMSNGFRVTICSRRKWFKHLEDAISYRDEELKKYV